MSYLETAGVIGALLFRCHRRRRLRLCPRQKIRGADLTHARPGGTRRKLRHPARFSRTRRRQPGRPQGPLHQDRRRRARRPRRHRERHLADLRRELNVTTSTMHELKGEMKQLTTQLILIQQELSKR